MNTGTLRVVFCGGGDLFVHTTREEAKKFIQDFATNSIQGENISTQFSCFKLAAVVGCSYQDYPAVTPQDTIKAQIEALKAVVKSASSGEDWKDE